MELAADSNDRVYRKALLAVLSLAGLGLMICSCTPVPRDPSGRAMFVATDFRHGSGLPYFCYDADIGNQPMSFCFLQPDQCANKMLGARRVVVEVVKSVGCTPVDEVYCYEEYGPFNAVSCSRTAQHCEASRQWDVANEGYSEKDTSLCTRVDKSYQPVL